MDEKVWGKLKRETFADAEEFLALLMPVTQANEIANKLMEAPDFKATARNIIRAAELPLLSVVTEVHSSDRVRPEEPYSPVLAVRFTGERKLTIVDGYERLCQSVYLT